MTIVVELACVISFALVGQIAAQIVPRSVHVSVKPAAPSGTIVLAWSVILLSKSAGLVAFIKISKVCDRKEGC